MYANSKKVTIQENLLYFQININSKLRSSNTDAEERFTNQIFYPIQLIIQKYYLNIEIIMKFNNTFHFFIVEKMFPNLIITWYCQLSCNNSQLYLSLLYL